MHTYGDQCILTTSKCAHTHRDQRILTTSKNAHTRGKKIKNTCTVISVATSRYAHTQETAYSNNKEVRTHTGISVL